MKKFNLNTKYLKTGGYSVLVSVLAIAIIIVINLFANQLPTSWTKFDMSSGDILSIGEETEKIVSGIDDEINVYYISQLGNEDTYITTMLDKYKELSKKISVEQIDPALNPNFLTGDRQGIEEGSIIVESEKRSKVITGVDIYYPGYAEDDLMNYYYQYGSMPSTTGFDMEKLMTSAINYVTTDVLPLIYTLTGHGEGVISDTYKGYLSEQSMEVKELNLATSEAVPEDCDCIFLFVPQTDISSDEAERLLSYLKTGGKLMYVSSYMYTSDQPNLKTVLDYYGVSASKGVIYEGDANLYLPQYPYMLLAKYGSHEIVDPLSSYGMFMGFSQGIITNEELRDTLKVTPLLYTSDKAYSKIDIESQTAEKEEGDIEGPFNYAVAITDKNDDGSEAQIVWVNSPMLMIKDYDYYGTLEAMFVNSFAWMCDKAESISIPVKSFEQEMLTVSEAQGNIMSALFMIVIPVSVVAVGFVVWFRRRSK